MHYSKGFYKKGVLLHDYSQSAILHAPHFRRVVNGSLCLLFAHYSRLQAALSTCGIPCNSNGLLATVYV